MKKLNLPEEYPLNPEELEVDSHRIENFEKNIPFQLSPDAFINFAELDLKGDSTRDIINALSNIKRAIENRIDCLLWVFKYSSISDKWGFPRKMEKINKLGIVAPRILGKINKIRNLLEHNYEVPKKTDVEDAFDVAVLFMESTKIFIKNFINDFEYYSESVRIEGLFFERGIRLNIYKEEDSDEKYPYTPINHFINWEKINDKEFGELLEYLKKGGISNKNIILPFNFNPEEISFLKILEKLGLEYHQTPEDVILGEKAAEDLLWNIRKKEDHIELKNNEDIEVVKKIEIEDRFEELIKRISTYEISPLDNGVYDEWVSFLIKMLY